MRNFLSAQRLLLAHNNGRSAFSAPIRYFGLVCIVAAATFLPALAQTEKNSWMLGGGMSLGSSSPETGENRFSMSVSPRVGYFVAPDLALGSLGLVGFSTQKSSSQFWWGIGPFARYYFATLSPSVKLFGEASVNYSYANGSATSILTSVDGTQLATTMTSASIGAGAAFFLTRNVAIEGLLRYVKSSSEMTSSSGSYTANLPTYKSTNIDFSVGLQVYW